jgi:hypothetical protein
MEKTLIFLYNISMKEDMFTSLFVIFIGAIVVAGVLGGMVVAYGMAGLAAFLIGIGVVTYVFKTLV